MAAGGPDRRVIAGAVAVPLVILLVLVATAVLGGGDDEDAPDPSGPVSTTAPVAVDADWDRAVADAFRPLAEALPTYARAVAEWSEGDRSDDELAATLDLVEPVLSEVVADAAALPSHRTDDRAGPLVAAAAELYVQGVAAHRAALAATDGDVAEQWDRLGRRLRILGDRTFDRARERTSPAIDAGDSVDLRLPAEVPDFDRLELAVGPPLEAATADVTDALPRLRAGERPTQPLDDWQRAVDALDVPATEDVRAALSDADALGGLARRLVGAAEALRDEPVPDGDRGRADRLALGWLVLADASRAGRARRDLRAAERGRGGPARPRPPVRPQRALMGRDVAADPASEVARRSSMIVVMRWSISATTAGRKRCSTSCRRSSCSSSRLNAETSAVARVSSRSSQPAGTVPAAAAAAGVVAAAVGGTVWATGTGAGATGWPLEA